MKAGISMALTSAFHTVFRIGGPALVAALLLMQVAPAMAQTPDEACAADSLYLISPEAIDLSYQTDGKIGLTVSWPNLNLDQATCFSLSDTTGLDYSVAVSGGFGDRVDRVLTFSSLGSGVIGSAAERNLQLGWSNDGPATYGTLSGTINLSNNGGVWQYTGNGSSWAQANTGLPMTWKLTNASAIDLGQNGFMLAGFTRGATTDSEPTGLYRYEGATWERLSEDVFTQTRLVRNVAVSPADNGHFLVGTENDGLFVTTDGGQTYTQWTTNLDPTFDNMPTNFRVDALAWEGNRIYVFINILGLFTSTDGGLTFTRSPITVPNTLDTQTPTYEIPTANSVWIDPSDNSRALISLQFHGAYETTDGGVSWGDLYGDLLVPDPGPDPISGAWVHSATSTVVLEGSPQTIIMGVKQKGIYRTDNGGTNWVLVADEPDLQPENLASLTNISLVSMPGFAGYVLAQEDGWSILRSLDGGVTWDNFPSQPPVSKALRIVAGPSGSGNFTYASYGGGIYVPGTSLPLTETYDSGTSSELRSMDLGLSITFTAGTHNPGDSFKLVCQTSQGWAVWRGPGHDRSQMTLLGLFDNVNPEDCFEGYCGDNSLEIVPNCFAAKRAACFDLSDPDTLRFFDQEVYNGFEYVYSVTTFDYGNTALLTPENNSNEMLFSARYDGDDLSPFPGGGNAVPIQINIEAVDLVQDDEIYVYPNPIRLDAGLPRGQGTEVVFTNIPEGSTIQVFTTSGDRVIELLPESLQGRNMFWDTQNDSGEDLAAGVYLYKVDMTEREDYWGRLVIIR